MWQNSGKRAYDLHSVSLYRSGCSFISTPTPASINDSGELQSEPDHGSAFVRSPRIKAGCGFLLSVDLETVSRSESIFWDAVSAAHPIRKACPSIWPQTGARFPDGSRRRPSQTGSLASRHPRHPPERATLAASMPPRTARRRARRSQTNFKRTRVGHAAFLATYRPVLAGRSLGGH